jgi:hypothetical protein
MDESFQDIGNGQGCFEDQLKQMWHVLGKRRLLSSFPQQLELL